MQTTPNSLAALIQAVAFAADKHRNQRRKDAEVSPYINHPIALANVLANEGGVQDVTVLCAAVLHDTIEDTETTADELRAVFGDQVASVVLEVTDDKLLGKAVRKQLQIEHAPHCSPQAKLVKLATRSAICATSWPRHPQTGRPSANRLTSTGLLQWSQACAASTRGWRRCLTACMRGAWSLLPLKKPERPQPMDYP